MQQTSDAPTIAKLWHRSITIKLIGGLVALFVLLLLVITFVPMPEDSVVPAVKVDATVIQAKNQFNSHHSISTTNHVFLLLEHVAVINNSDHPVMRGVADKLVEQLRNHPGLQTVHCVDATQQSQWCDDGEQLPDMFIVLDMLKFTETGLLATGRDIKATLEIGFSQNIGDSAHHTTDGYTPPVIDVQGHMTLEHQSTSHGYESANAQYQCVIKNITEQIHEQLTGNFQKWAGEYPQLTVIPQGLYPAYRPLPSDFPLPDEPTLKQVFTGRKIMCHNTTSWTMRVMDGKTSDVLFEAYVEKLKAAGWHVDDYDKRNGQMNNNHLRAIRDAAVLEMFEDRHNQTIDADKPIDIVLRFDDRFNRQDMAKVMEMLLSQENLPLQTWLTFERLMDRQTRDQFIKRYLDTPGLSVDIQLMVIDYLQRHKQKDEASKRLESFGPIAVMIDSKHKSEIKRLGQQLTGDKKWKIPKVTIDTFKNADIPFLPDNQEQIVTTKRSEPVMFYGMGNPTDDAPDVPVLIHILVEPSDIPQGKYKLSLKVLNPDHGNDMTSSIRHDPPTPWRDSTAFSSMNRTWQVNAMELSDGKFELKVISYNKLENKTNESQTTE